jgi:hypothetical protein
MLPARETRKVWFAEFRIERRPAFSYFTRYNNQLRSLYYNRLMSDATYPAPNPLSMFTTLTFDAQEFIMPSSAASPLNAAP